MGIIGFDYEPKAMLYSFILLISGVLGYISLSFHTGMRSEKFKLLALFLGLVAIGGLSISFTRHDSYPIDKNSSVIVEIKEINQPNESWRKAICTATSSVNEDTLMHLDEKMLVFFKSDQLKVGDVLMLNANFSYITNKNNPGEFDVKSFWNNKNIYQIGFVGENDFRLIDYHAPGYFRQFFLSIRDNLSRQLSRYLDNEDALGVAKALLLGDKQLLSSEVRGHFSNAGAMHVLAVSGLHVGIVLYLLMFVLGRFPRFISKRSAALTAVIIIWMYAGVTGFSPSVIRASFMFSMLVFAQLSGKNYNAMNVLFFTAFVLLVLDPMLIYDIGFQLSYLAMVGIFLLYPFVRNWFYFKNKWISKLWEGTAVGIAAQALTVPLTLYYFHQFPNYFMLTNIGMMALSGVLLGIGMFFFAVYWSSTLLFAVGTLLKVGILGMLFFVQFVDWLPGSVARGFTLSPAMLSIIYLCIICAVEIPFRKRWRAPAILIAVVLFTGIQWERYDNLTTNELVIFNADDVVISVRQNGNIYCFHSAPEEKVKKVEMLMQNYTAIRPGTVHYIPLNDGETKFSAENNSATIYKNKYGVDFESQQASFYIRTAYSASYLELKNVVDIPYLASSSGRYNLEEGATVISLN